MIKQDIVNRLVEKFPGLDEDSAKNYVNCIVELLCEGLAKGEKIIIRGLGTIYTYERTGRILTNLNTGKPINVKPYRLVSFRSGTSLKKLINKGQ